jgi:hypothetical protein
LFCVLGLTRLRQRLDRTLVKLAHFPHMPRLVRQAADKDFVGTVRKINRSDQQNGFPMLATSNDHGSHRPGAAGDHETGAAPEKIVAPDSEE